MYSSNLLKRNSKNTCTFYNMPEIDVTINPAVTYKKTEAAKSSGVETAVYIDDFFDSKGHDALDKAKSDSMKILEDAQKKADDIITESSIKAQELYSENFLLAQKKGYSEGMMRAQADAQKQIDDIMEHLQSVSDILVEEKKTIINSSENLIIDLASEIARKIVCENFMQEDTGIFYTVFQNAVQDIPPAERLIVTVSGKDYKIKTFSPDKLKHLASDFKNIEIRVDNEAEPGTLRLETPIMMIDASINNQIGLIKKEVGSLL